MAELVVGVYEEVLGDWLDDEYRVVLADVAGRAEVAEVLVAVDEAGAVVGTATYMPPTPGGGDGEGGPGAEAEGRSGIRMLAVAPAARRRGWGRALVEACVARARADGCREVALHTTPLMVGAQALYEGAGFVREPAGDRPLPRRGAILGYVRVLG